MTSREEAQGGSVNFVVPAGARNLPFYGKMLSFEHTAWLQSEKKNTAWVAQNLFGGNHWPDW